VVLDALPDRQFHAKVSRVADSEDRTTRSMRTEIDLQNPDGDLRDGMFLRVTIYLDAQNKGVTIPSTCLVEDNTGNKTSVFVVREGKVERKQVSVGRDDGIRVEILDGLSAHDQVVSQPGGDLSDGEEVSAGEHSEAKDDQQDHKNGKNADRRAAGGSAK